MSLLSLQFKRDYNELNPVEKTPEWANRLVRDFRLNAKYLADPQREAKNKSYLYSEQSMEKFKKMFKFPEKLNFDFAPLGVFEKPRNILTAEREKAGIYISLNAQDPTAQVEKDYDKKLLTNASFIEDAISYMNLACGLPKYSLATATKDNGDKISKGNLDTFKELGLDPNSPGDVAYFFKTHWRMDTEVEGEDAVNYFVRTNELQEIVLLWMDDILAVKAAAGRVYANEKTFTPEYDYLKPSQVRWIPGKRRDGKDAKCIMSEENLTMADFLARTGTQVTAENALSMVDAVNFHNATSYDGLSLSSGAETVNYGNCNNPIHYDAFLGLKVGVGYVEWKSVDVKNVKTGTNIFGNYKRWDKPFDWEPRITSSYKKESIFNMVTYKCYYLMRTSNTHEIVSFGKLFDQVTYGPEDEYSSFSFQVYKEAGPSAIDISIPFIDNIHAAWFKFNWMMYKVRPRGTRYNYNVIAKIAQKAFPKTSDDDTEWNSVMSVIKLFQESNDDFYVNDSLNPNVGGGQNPHFEKPNGLDPAVKELYEIFKTQQELISDKLGINAIREAYSPSPNDGYKLQMQSLAQSRNATEYLSRMILRLLNNYAKHTLTIVQDAIEVKGSEGYKAIERGLGIKSIWALQALKRVPLHKFGIFVETFNTDLERAEMMQEAKEAWIKGEIPYHVYLMLKSVNNFKKGAIMLAYEKAKENERKQAEAEQMHQQQMELINAKNETELGMIDREYEGRVAVQEKANEGYIEVARINQDGHIQTRQMQIDAEPGKSMVRSNAKIQENDAKQRSARGQGVGVDAV